MEDKAQSLLQFCSMEQKNNNHSSSQDFKAVLTSLFKPPGGEAPALEKESEDKIARLTQAFLQATNVSAPLDLEPLAKKFTDSRIPVEPVSVQKYIDHLADNVVAHSIHTSSPRFIGHMASALPFFVRPLSKLMSTMNQNMVKVETAKALSLYERQVLAMIHRLIFKFPDDFYEQHTQNNESTLGIMVSGGTLANITALWCARNASLAPRDGFAGVAQEGIAAALAAHGYHSAVIIGSNLMHYSFEKAADILGLGGRNLIKIPATQRHQINLRELRQVIADCRVRRQKIIALVGVAGTTEAGAVDPLAEMAEIACENGIHFHVDAAWGGPLLFSARHRDTLTGIERADSVTFDGHKQLYLPMGVGMVAFRNPLLARYIEKHAHYVIRARSADLGKRSLEGSRPAMALFVHAALHIFGQRGYEFLIDEGIRKARYMADAIHRHNEFELLTQPETNILTYRYIPEQLRAGVRGIGESKPDNQAINEFNKRLQIAQRQEGRSFISRTTLTNTQYGEGVEIIALRAVIANPLTTERDIDAVLEDQARLAASLLKDGSTDWMNGASD